MSYNYILKICLVYAWRVEKKNGSVWIVQQPNKQNPRELASSAIFEIGWAGGGFKATIALCRPCQSRDFGALGGLGSNCTGSNFEISLLTNGLSFL